jgi:hypothetical protein
MTFLKLALQKMKALTAKMETVSLIGKGRENVTCLCIKCVKLIVKYYFLADVLFLRFVKIWINTFFSLADVFFGGCLRLELACIWVNTVYAGHKQGYKYNLMSRQRS